MGQLSSQLWPIWPIGPDRPYPRSRSFTIEVKATATNNDLATAMETSLGVLPSCTVTAIVGCVMAGRPADHRAHGNDLQLCSSSAAALSRVEAMRPPVVVARRRLNRLVCRIIGLSRDRRARASPRGCGGYGLDAAAIGARPPPKMLPKKVG